MATFRRLKYSFTETFKFYGSHPKHVGIVLFLLVFGSATHWFITKNKEGVMDEFLVFSYYTLIPIGILTVLIFIVNFIRADLKFELDNRKNISALTKKSSESNVNYLEYVGRLWDLLNEFDYNKEYKERKDGLNMFVPHSYYTIAYKELDKWKVSLFYNNDLRALLDEFLLYFKYWNSTNYLLPVYEIKPSFDKEKDYINKKKQIKKIIDDIANQINQL